MTDREDLIRAVEELAVVCGCVTLASGRRADYYVDIHHVTLDEAASPLVGRAVSELAADLDFDVVGGLILGADSVVTAVLYVRAVAGGRPDALVVRKEAKPHGLQRRIEGTDVMGRRALAVEDTSTMDGSALTAAEATRRADDEVVAMAMVVDRATGMAERATEASLEYRYAIGLEEPGL